MSFENIVKTTPALRSIALPVFRARVLLGYLSPSIKEGFRWLWKSRETTNFTYELSPKNLDYLCTMLSVVTGLPANDFAKYIREIESDNELREHITTVTASSDLAYKADKQARFHKRLGWYALVRAVKPRIVVETGVDKGLGAVVLCAALLRNRSEGHEGQYFGTDINPKAGYLLCGPYSEVGEVLYGDSLESIGSMTAQIDIFINDSDHSASYEAAEYEAIFPLLSKGGIILGDNSHVTPALHDFSRKHDKKFLFWKEEPIDHWYPGGGIGFSFNR